MSLEEIIAAAEASIRAAYALGQREERARMDAYLNGKPTTATKAAPKKAAKPKKALSKKAIPAKKLGKSTLVRDVIQQHLAKSDSVSREEVLKSAQGKNPDVTKYDVGNATNVLVKNDKIETHPDHIGMIFRRGAINSAAAH